MSRANSRTFRSGNGEAVRLPKAVAFGREIEAIDPIRPSIADFIKRLTYLPRPAAIEVRDIEPLP